jgi:hypothetical protein
MTQLQWRHIRPYDQSNIISIDEALEKVQCFPINTFHFKVGDCLFDTVHVLLHGQYMPNELRNGIVNHFLDSLHNDCVEALYSYENELHPSMLYDLHRIQDKQTYLRRMRVSATEVNKHGKVGLWGDIFCI